MSKAKKEEPPKPKLTPFERLGRLRGAEGPSGTFRPAKGRPVVRLPAWVEDAIAEHYTLSLNVEAHRDAANTYYNSATIAERLAETRRVQIEELEAVLIEIRTELMSLKESIRDDGK